MVSRRRLSARAVALSSDAPTTLVSSRLSMLPEGHRALLMPRTPPPWLRDIANQLADGAAALALLLTEPTRCYELLSSEGERRLALLLSVEYDPQQLLISGELHVPLDARKQAVDWGSLRVATADLADLEARELLVHVAEQLSPQSLRARDPDGAPPVALVIGDLQSAQRDALQRRLWAHGVRVDGVLEQPYRNGGAWARQQVQRFAGDLLVLNQPGCGGVFGRLLSDVRGGVTPIILAERDPELWPLELDEALDSVSVDAPDRAVRTEGESRITWREGAELVKALPDEDGRFIVTERCAKRLDRNPHPDPADMVEHVERLKDLALRWSNSARAGGLGGDFVEIARTQHDLIISRYDEPLRRAKLHLFEHDGRSHSREHHVKVNDHTTPDRVGRIYFALDDDHDPPRLIVDHIGLKLSPYVKR